MDDPTVEYLAEELEEALQPFADAGWHVSICGDWIDADHVGLIAVVDAVPVLNLRVFASCDGSREFLMQELWNHRFDLVHWLRHFRANAQSLGRFLAVRRPSWVEPLTVVG
ncbi:hypothetical protein [Ruegeria arenilitoris]|uniref:hypothetical protein n=1 Tax=Ruegeria arenilitoris TaxID=1173585 RepID=UPI00147AEF48|nr:hypothetical protein [Ruegeria arenilitoris]